jgi:hypothetical protein
MLYIETGSLLAFFKHFALLQTCYLQTDQQTDQQTDRQTLSGIELLLQLKNLAKNGGGGLRESEWPNIVNKI